MSQWHNSPWPNGSNKPPQPREQPNYQYGLPTQNPKYARHPYAPEFEGTPTSNPYNNIKPGPGAQQLAPAGAQGAQPAQTRGLGPPGQLPYMQLPMQQYQTMPPDFSHGNYPMHNDQWDQLTMGVRHQHQGQPVPADHGKKRRSRRSLADNLGSESGSGDQNETTRPRLVLGLQKVTKRLRMGCLTCRQRKKRCCESRPKCTECLRLRLNCVWPQPGTEHKNKPKEVKSQENTIEHDVYGKIKVLRGIVEYRSN